MPADPYASQGRETDPEWVRARTQSEIDAELAAWADAPMWTGTGADVSGAEIDAGPPTEPMPVASPAEPEAPAVDYSWLYREPGSTRAPGMQTLEAPRDREPVRIEPPAPAQPHRRRHTVLASVLGLALCLSLGGGAAMVAFGNLGAPHAAPSSPTEDGPARPVPGQVWEGNLTPIGPVTAEAECVAPTAKDAAGEPVAYDAANAVDGDPATAWRCDRSSDVAISFTVPEDQQIASVGLINGYAKVDQTDGSKRYGEYRRILRVTWTLPDGSTVDQDLVDGDQTMQDVRVPVSQGGRITLNISRVTNPGSASATRDAVVISDVAINGPQG